MIYILFSNEGFYRATQSFWSKFYRGKITQVNKSGNQEVTYDVQFDDGETKKNLKSRDIKRLNGDERLEEQRVDVLRK